MVYRGRGRGAYPGNGPFRDLLPWQRPGWLYGEGAEVMETNDPNRCQRFPQLPRRWWVNTEAKSGEISNLFDEQLKQILEQQIAATESHSATLRKRLDELNAREKTE